MTEKLYTAQSPKLGAGLSASFETQENTVLDIDVFTVYSSSWSRDKKF